MLDPSSPSCKFWLSCMSVEKPDFDNVTEKNFDSRIRRNSNWYYYFTIRIYSNVVLFWLQLLYNENNNDHKQDYGVTLWNIVRYLLRLELFDKSPSRLPMALPFDLKNNMLTYYGQTETNMTLNESRYGICISSLTTKLLEGVSSGNLIVVIGM